MKTDVSPAGHHRPHPQHHLYDRGRRCPHQRGPGLCAAPPAAPGRPPPYRLLGIHEPFLYKVCETVIAENEKAYPELRGESRTTSSRSSTTREERFAKTIDQGMELLGDLIDRIEAESLSEEEKIPPANRPLNCMTPSASPST